MPLAPTDGGETPPAVATETLPAPWPGVLGYAWAPDGSGLVLVDLNESTSYFVDAETAELRPLAWSSSEWPSWQSVQG